MKALVIVDWQNEYIDHQSEYFVGSDLKDQTVKLNFLIKKFREEGYPILFIKHNELEGSNFLKDSKNSQIVEEVDIQPEDVVINKYRISSFYKTNLEEVLQERNISDLYITGILTNLCVRSLISDAYDRDYNITVVKDLCITFNNDIQDFTLRDLKETRPEIEISLSSEI